MRECVSVSLALDGSIPLSFAFYLSRTCLIEKNALRVLYFPWCETLGDKQSGLFNSDFAPLNSHTCECIPRALGHLAHEPRLYLGSLSSFYSFLSAALESVFGASTCTLCSAADPLMCSLLLCFSRCLFFHLSLLFAYLFLG